MIPSAGLLLLWCLILIQDLRRRQVRVAVLAGVAGLSLAMAPWPWWPLVGVALLWPPRWRRQALWLAAPAILIGLAVSDSSPAVAIVAGVVAWALGWWGGADAITLMCLVLRYGPVGLIGGSLAAVIAGVILMVVRRRSVWRLVVAAQDGLALRPAPSRDEEGESGEMPAAAFLAVVGMVLEAMALTRAVAAKMWFWTQGWGGL